MKHKSILINKLMSFYIVFLMVVACFAGISLITSPSVKATLSMSDVLGYWNFDDVVQGTTCQEMKTGDDELTFSGGMSWNDSGKLGHCVYADGTNGMLLSNVSYESNYDFDYTDPFSIEFWYNGDTTQAGYRDVIGKGSVSGCSGWQIFLNGQKLVFYAGGWSSACYSNSTLPSNVWIHIVLTYDGSGNSDGMDWYFNGTDAGHTVGGTSFSSWVTDFSLKSFFNFCDNYYMSGYIDEVVIYNKALTPTDVTSRWNSGAGQDYTFSGGTPSDDPPIFSSPSPANGTTCLDPNGVDFSVYIEQPQGSGMNIDMSCYSETDDAKIESYEGSTTWTPFYGISWKAQGFTVTYNSYITQVSIKCARVGSGAVGNVTVGIRAATTSGKPTGPDLVNYTQSANGWSTSYVWYNFTFTTPFYATGGTVYTLVFRAPSGTTANYIRVSHIGSNAYSNGVYSTSSNSGSVWNAYAYEDNDFRIYGYERTNITSSSLTGYINYNDTYVLSLGDLAKGLKHYVNIHAHTLTSLWTNESYWFETGDNTPTAYSSLNKVNHSTGCSLSFQWQIALTDLETTFNYTIQCSNGQSKTGTNVASGLKYLNLSGLVFAHTYKMWVNVTDKSPGGCGVYTRNWWFDFTTINANSPSVTHAQSPTTPAWLSSAVGALWWKCNISDPAGLLMTWTLDCPGIGTYGGSGHNGTLNWNMSGLALGTGYTVWTNVSNGFNATNNSWSFTTRTNTVQVLGIPIPANGSIGIPAGTLTWQIPITDVNGDNINCTVSCGATVIPWHIVSTPGTIAIGLTGLAYLTNYTVNVNTTDNWGNAVNRWYTFTVEAYSGGGTPYVIYNTDLTFSFKDSNGSSLDFADLSYNAWLFNGSDITVMDYYIHGGDLTINFTAILGFTPFDIAFTLDTSLVYTDYSNTFLVIDHGTYTIILIKRIPDYVFENRLNRTWSNDWIGLETDHKEYYIGQDIVFRYRLPLASWFTSGGKNINSYSLLIHKYPNWISGGGIFGTDSIYTNSVWRNPSTGLTLDYGQWITMVLDPTTFTGGYPASDTEYRINFGADDVNWWFWNDIPTNTGLSFTLLNIPLVPTGAFVTPPSNSTVGTTETFTYTANNRGQIEIDDLYKSGATETYQFNVNDLIFTHEFNTPSVYRINLQIWNGATGNQGSFVTVDTIPAFNVYNANGSSGSIGYNVEYLDPERKQLVAGLNPLEFVYSTLKSPTTEFIVKNPDGETTRYSTTIASPAVGTYSHDLPSTVPIGRWNVTMYGNKTLSFSFYVVADENNYIDFIKNEYLDTDSFQVYVIHNVKVLLKFYKEDGSGTYVAKGSKTFIEKTIPNGLFTIDRALVTPTSGNWKVEMWECDNRIEIRLLSVYYATVTVTLTGTNIPSGGGGILPAMDPVMGAIVGLIITIFLLLCPFIVSKVLHVETAVHPLIFALTGGLGIAISVILGLFPGWIVPFICVIGVIICILLYLIGKRDGGGGV